MPGLRRGTHDLRLYHATQNCNVVCSVPGLHAFGRSGIFCRRRTSRVSYAGQCPHRQLDARSSVNADCMHPVAGGFASIQPSPSGGNRVGPKYPTAKPCPQMEGGGAAFHSEPPRHLRPLSRYARPCEMAQVALSYLRPQRPRNPTSGRRSNPATEDDDASDACKPAGLPGRRTVL